MGKQKTGRYDALIEKIFFDHYKPEDNDFTFYRSEVICAAEALDVSLPRNIGDLFYSYRFRKPLPDRIIKTQPEGMEWVIVLSGKGVYRFSLVKQNRIYPRQDLVAIAIPDSTPEIIRAYSLNDEQALLAIVRYNRLVDTFLGLTTYSLQNHLRTTVEGMGQIEIDELYIGLDKRGCHYVIPIQAKGGKDQIGSVQISQDIQFVNERFPELRCRAVSAQFMDNDVVALFELVLQDNEIKVAEERHYRLIPASQIDDEAIRNYHE
ncbi:hypothetical protein [Thioalkalivibrio sp. ALE20]|uniref:hypothetical protein n=1 Tax=Thioalkalivibrio sp. ALE20 TaxID=545275 RepID=UPI000477AA1F|nr:hypothetical protein [Thioalkalivibrio sp. ALE20]